jgi:hypothetical protein
MPNVLKSCNAALVILLFSAMACEVDDPPPLDESCEGCDLAVEIPFDTTHTAVPIEELVECSYVENFFSENEISCEPLVLPESNANISVAYSLYQDNAAGEHILVKSDSIIVGRRHRYDGVGRLVDEFVDSESFSVADEIDWVEIQVEVFQHTPNLSILREPGELILPALGSYEGPVRDVDAQVFRIAPQAFSGIYVYLADDFPYMGNSNFLFPGEDWAAQQRSIETIIPRKLIGTQYERWPEDPAWFPVIFDGSEEIKTLEWSLKSSPSAWDSDEIFDGTTELPRTGNRHFVLEHRVVDGEPLCDLVPLAAHLASYGQ